MELKDFIREALVQVVTGVEEAREELKGKGVLINPLVFGDKRVFHQNGGEHGGRQTQSLEFNIAVTTESKEGKKTGLGVVAGFLSAGIGGSNESGAINFNSLKFSIPFSLAGDKDTKK